MQNLRDKLLKAGLVSNEQASTVPTESKPAQPSAPRESRTAQSSRTGESRPAPSSGPRDGRSPRPPHNAAPRPPAGGSASPRGPRPQALRGERPSRPPSFQQARKPAAEIFVPKLPPMPGSKAYQRIQSKKQLETDRTLREMVLAAQIPQDAGGTTFYFVTRKGRLRRMEISSDQAKHLEDGVLAVVERPDPAQVEHALVPAAIAEAMLALNPKCVRFLNKKDGAIGFISDEELSDRQAKEASGEAVAEEAKQDAIEAHEAQAEVAAEQDSGAADVQPEPVPSQTPEENS